MQSYQILDGFNKGEGKAQGIVWKKYFKEVFSNARKLTNGSPDAEDIASDIMEKLLYETTTTFESLENIRSHLYVVVQRECAKRLPKLRIVATDSGDIIKHYQDFEPDDLEAAKIRANLYARIKNAIDELTPKCKRVFMPYYLRNLKNREIAAELGISEKTVEKHKSNAFKKLRIEIRFENGRIISIIFL